jgi:hypothetical protein
VNRTDDSTALPRLLPRAEVVAVHPVADWREVLDRLDPAATLWGMAATAARAELGRYPVERWRQILERPRLIEARLFDETRDLHWLEGRGVVLEVAGSGAAGDGPDRSPPAERIGGDAWLQRDRCSRLWGEWLEDTDTWYEERIPDPLRYPGIEPGAGHRYVFLRYREYIREGRVEYVRYLGLEGGKG